jgi:hypothetical protein
MPQRGRPSGQRPVATRPCDLHEDQRGNGDHRKAGAHKGRGVERIEGLPHRAIPFGRSETGGAVAPPDA